MLPGFQGDISSWWDQRPLSALELTFSAKACLSIILFVLAPCPALLQYLLLGHGDSDGGLTELPECPARTSCLLGFLCESLTMQPRQRHDRLAIVRALAGAAMRPHLRHGSSLL
jgi:hypothetical protein